MFPLRSMGIPKLDRSEDKRVLCAGGAWTYQAERGAQTYLSVIFGGVEAAQSLGR